MALEFSRVGNRPLVNLIIADMMALAHFLIVHRYFLAKEVFDLILGKIELLVVLDLTSDGNSNQSSPLVPYDLMNRLSLLGLINEAVSTANTNGENESEGAPTKDYGELARFLESMERHLRNLSDNTLIGASPTFLYVAQLIEQTLEMVLRVTTMNECSDWDKKDLLDRVSWLLAVFWTAFSTAAKMGRTHHWNAVRACDLLAYFGMVFYNAGFKEFAVSAAKHIASVTASYTQATGSPATLDVADLLVYGHQIELAVTKMGDAEVGKEIAQIVSCPNFISDSIRNQFLEDLQLRKDQLIEELGQPDRHDPFKSTRFLRGILSEGVSDQSSES